MDLSRREKRQLGVLPWQLLILASMLSREGAITKDTTSDELAGMLMAEAQSGNPRAWAARADRDWESFFAALAEFLKTVAPVILEIILRLV